MRVNLMLSLVVLSLAEVGCRSASETQPGELVFFSERAKFLATVTSPATIDFGKGNHDQRSVTRYSTADGLTLSGVRFTGISRNAEYTLDVYGPESRYLPPRNGNPSSIVGAGDGYIAARLPTGTRALGFDVFTTTSTNPVPQDVRITLSTGHAFTVHTLPPPGLQFVGFTSPVPLLSVRIETVTGQANPGMSGFVYSTSAADLCNSGASK